ncbi:MAG TPA: phosphatidylserine decarboxylase family protein [Gemmatimonadales bacterium]|nr:phosphatidylserine decarboxylase family protein [Gemmatimonadales bacterium]
MRIAPEGWPFIAVATLVCVVLALFRLWWPLALWLPLTIWVVAFFRDPARPGPRGDGLVIAPADGRVVSVIPIDEPTFLGGPAIRISIFMNVFNVHVNRYPADGTVAHREYTPGKFLNAATEKASRENEQSSIGLETSRGRILVRQIAGLVARRIVTDHGAGTVVRQGERLGLIRFGSRVDVFVPTGARPLVAVGETTRAGQTIIAEWPR